MSIERDILKLDVSGASDLKTLEDGIKRAQRVVDAGRLVIALAIYRIESERLYLQAGFTNSAQYFRSAQSRLELSQPSVSQYRTIGYVYTKYREQLEKAGYDPAAESVKKLVFVPRALQHHPSDRVFKNLVKMSHDQFAGFASGITESDIDTTAEGNPVQVTRSGLELGDLRVFSFEPDAPVSIKCEVSAVFRDWYAIKNRGDIPLLVDVKDNGERLAVRRFIRKYREGTD